MLRLICSAGFGFAKQHSENMCSFVGITSLCICPSLCILAALFRSMFLGFATLCLISVYFFVKYLRPSFLHFSICVFPSSFFVLLLSLFPSVFLCFLSSFPPSFVLRFLFMILPFFVMYFFLSCCLCPSAAGLFFLRRLPA